MFSTEWLRKQAVDGTTQAIIGAAVLGLAGTIWAAASKNAPKYSSVGWLTVFVLLTASLLVLVGIAGWARSHWPQEPTRPKPHHSIDPPTAAVAATPTEIILRNVKRPFLSETVVLDGYNFDQCSFKNCTLRYNGGHFQMRDCKISGQTTVNSENQTVQRTIRALHALNLLLPGMIAGSRKDVLTHLSAQEEAKSGTTDPHKS